MESLHNSLLTVPKVNYGKLKNYICGQWVDSASNDVRDIINPATGTVIARIPYSTPVEVNNAVMAAKEAFEQWKDISVIKRARYFFKLKQLMEEHFEDLSRTVVQENGKTIDEARNEIQRAIEEVECACGITNLMKGYLIEGVAPSIDLYVKYIPLGVFFMVPSFNFPALVPLEYFPYAVACGNTYVVKPSPLVPITQVKIFEMIDQCGFPPGVINLVHGDAEVVSTLIEHDDIKGLSFVGSTSVGKLLYEKAAKFGKRAQCATGAKNHFVVMPDADLKKTVKAMLASFFGCAGQRCLAGSIVVPVGDIYEPLIKEFVLSASKIKVGYGLDEEVVLGPVVNKNSMRKIIEYIERGIMEGAKLLLDGRNIVVEGYPNGTFIGPTIFDEVTPDMTIAKEEIFGPVACIIRTKSLDDALELIENSSFGHSAIIFTTNGNSARKFQHKANCGNIAINLGVASTLSFATLGGLKDSAFGDLHGRSESVLFFTDRKIVISSWE